MKCFSDCRYISLTWRKCTEKDLKSLHLAEKYVNIGPLMLLRVLIVSARSLRMEVTTR
jgi:hypothetical protein